MMRMMIVRGLMLALLLVPWLAHAQGPTEIESGRDVMSRPSLEEQIAALSARVQQLEAFLGGRERPFPPPTYLNIPREAWEGRFGFGIQPIQAVQPVNVNHLRFLSAATGSNPSIVAYGVDTNIGLGITLKGSGQITGTFSLNATPSSQTSATTTSYQALAGDFALGAAWGSSTAASPVYGGGVMGNIIAASTNLTATKNILFGVLGKYDHTGTNASTYPGAPLVGEIGDGVTAANYAIQAVVGGDTTAATARAAFGVDWQSSVVASRFLYGLDFEGGGTHDSYLAPRYNSAFLNLGGRTFDSNNTLIFTAAGVCFPVIVNSAPVDGVSGTRAGICGPGSLLIRMDNGTLFQNTNTLASPTWTAR